MPANQAVSFQFVGNHPSLDLLNTTPVLGEGPVELLNSYEDLARWMRDAGLMSPAQTAELRREVIRDAPVARSILREVKNLREALRSILMALPANSAIPADALATVNASLRRNRGYARVRGTANRAGLETEWHRERDDAAARVIAPIASSILDLLTETDLTRVRKCENPACVLWFLDTSKNNGRRWCSMEVCGNRTKVAAHYRRHRSTAKGDAAEDFNGD